MPIALLGYFVIMAIVKSFDGDRVAVYFKNAKIKTGEKRRNVFGVNNPHSWMD
ncbi:hypothetical protein [Magnetofaba australis]|uniref:hypothetical protein n=1 Tax=Magnetofaba australis TaxID=1472297 RepID=UPI0013020389|nr:hypothetical protein [Magnetofaba australis]